MIGMSQIKKKMLQGIAIGATIGVVGIGITGFFSYRVIKSYQDGTNKTYQRNFTTQVAVLTKDVVQGETITDDMITYARVHNSTVPTNAITSTVGNAIGKIAKYSIAANVPLTDTMLSETTIASDIRSQEYNSIVMPSDLSEGEYVDVRIMYTNGTDYIVLAQKKVEKIQGTTMWLDLGEDERLLLNSAIVDSYLEEGTKLYATKYVDQDAQIKISDDEAATAEGYVKSEITKQMDTIKTADEAGLTTILFGLVQKYKNFATTVSRTTENYQPNEQVMSLMRTNPNILAEATSKLSSEARANMENALQSYKNKNEDNYSNVVTGAQEAISTQKVQRTQLLEGEIVE